MRGENMREKLKEIKDKFRGSNISQNEFQNEKRSKWNRVNSNKC